MRGTQPILLFHNKKVLDKAGVKAPQTWDELLDAVKKLKAEGVTPIALGGGDRWPTLMWFEYLYDRIAGPGLFQKALGGDTKAWESDDSKKALSMIRELVDAGAFGKNYDSVKYTNGASPALLASGKAGFELMARGTTPSSRRTPRRSRRRTSATRRSRSSRAARVTPRTSSGTPTTSTRC